jgi:hypothetical protein
MLVKTAPFWRNGFGAAAISFAYSGWRSSPLTSTLAEQRESHAVGGAAKGFDLFFAARLLPRN